MDKYLMLVLPSYRDEESDDEGDHEGDSEGVVDTTDSPRYCGVHNVISVQFEIKLVLPCHFLSSPVTRMIMAQILIHSHDAALGSY